MAMRVEPADVDVAQVHVMDRDVAGDRQARLFRRPHARDSVVRRQPRQMHVHAGRAHQLEDGLERDGLGAGRDRRQAQPRRHFAVVRDAAPGKMHILRPQPHAIAKGRRVLQRAQQHLRVGERRVRLRERDAAGLRELAHFGDRFALQTDGQRADGIDVRLIEQARAMLEHLDQARLVERRIGVRRAGQVGNAAGDRRRHFRFERGLVFESRLAQPRRRSIKPGQTTRPVASMHAVGMPARRRRAQRRDLAGGDVDGRDAIDSAAWGR